MIDFLVNTDQRLFEILNGINSPFWDDVMWLISNKYSWIPVYILLLALIFLRKNLKSALLYVLMFVPLIGLSDQLSSSVIKPLVERPRPCHTPELFENEVHIVDGKCGGPYGFVSSHATNFFAMATFLFLTLGQKELKWGIIFFSIAMLVAYSRVYLGVHYPGDILAGAMLGILVAFLCYFGYRWMKRRLSLQIES